jgi:hypothetical protein
MKREAEQKKLHWMVKVHKLLNMWQGSYNLWASKNKTHPKTKEMSAVGYISDMQEIVIAM